MYEKEVNQVAKTSIIINILLFIFKFIGGTLGKSAALISDAFHSLTDVLTTFIALIGINLSNKEADEEHQYGHEKFEGITAIILAFSLFITAILIMYNSIENFNKVIEIPTKLALVAALTSIIVKEWMYHYTIKTARKAKSTALQADAWHHRSDALSSIGSLIGIILSMSGFKYGDIIACFFITLCIFKASYDIFVDAMNKIVDKACSKEDIEKYIETINKSKEIKNIDDIKTRIFGNKVYLDIEIALDEKLPLIKAHKIAEKVHDKLEKNHEEIKHCTIHVNPYKKED